MRSWLRQHRGALRTARRKLSAQKWAGAFNIAVIGIALSLPAGGYALLENLRAAAGPVRAEPEVSVFLRPEAKGSDAQALLVRLGADARVAQARLVSRETALEALRAEEGLGALLDGLEHNPLPDTVIVRLRDANSETIEILAAELRSLPVIERVQVDTLWARRLAALAALARLALGSLAALLAVGLVAVTFNTIRLQVLTHKEEIVVSKLIGAPDSFVQRPFLYQGMLQGLAGGLMALAIVWAGLLVLNIEAASLARTYGTEFRLRFLATGDALAIVAFSALLGWLGAYMAVSRHLRNIH